jgi:ApaG protein
VASVESRRAFFRVFRAFRGFLLGVTAPLELPGLRVELDKLVYHHGGSLPPDQPHTFVYYLTIHNDSSRTVTLLGRKWVIEHADGTSLVVEGDKIVGETPTLAPGGHFSYNSYHVTGCNGRVSGSFHGLDDQGRRIYVRIPAFDMEIPAG